ncbi:hypothetical protein [Comamonas composti]|uniref:hypothetical protein n=1 Tax=Comamonas composti TaxID=408558 RepID=UPI0004180D9B|nr:hypothetical protein [Comamonas composti]
MPSARHLLWQARLILACFAFTLGVGVAAPFLQPTVVGELICTTGGEIQLIADDGLDSPGPGSHELHCPLCLPVCAGPPPSLGFPPAAQPLAHALQPMVSAHIAALTRAPLPARGPPSSPALNE